MNEEKFIQLLQSCRRLEPREAFRADLRRTLLALARARAGAGRIEAPPSFRRGFFEDLKFGTALLLAGSFLFLIGVGFSHFTRGQQVARDLRSLDAGELLQEAQSLEFSIELGEVRYFEESAEAVAAVLDEISEAGEETGAPIERGVVN